MKKIVFIFLLLIAFLNVDAQVKFMGIPVDGDAQSMLKQIRAKGFTDMSETYEIENMKLPFLKGTFNGKPSLIGIVTNHKKVYRVHVSYGDYFSETQIIVVFNNLLDQFKNNPKYIHVEGQAIEQDERISYEMSVHNKIYEANFIQIVDDSIGRNLVWFRIYKSQKHGYYIAINYDNLINKPNGEDL